MFDELLLGSVSESHPVCHKTLLIAAVEHPNQKFFLYNASNNNTKLLTSLFDLLKSKYVAKNFELTAN